MRLPFQSGNDDGLDALRQRMVETQIRSRGISDPSVLKAMERVPRHAFVPEEQRRSAYADGPLPIGEGQTISQPYIVAVMTEALQLEAGDRVLEIGTGSGYQTAVLAEIGAEVYTVEFLESLSRGAQSMLEQLGYSDIHYRVGDGRSGWPAEGPFDGILVTAAPAEVPGPLLEQLAPGGRLVIPVGTWDQYLMVYRKNDDGSCSSETLFAVRFVPLVG